MSKVVWKSDPEDHDFPAAIAYLSLLASARRRARDRRRPARGDDDAPEGEGHPARLPVATAAGGQSPRRRRPRQDRQGQAAVAGPARPGLAQRRRPLQIADGYHRVCASYHDRREHRHSVPHRGPRADVMSFGILALIVAVGMLGPLLAVPRAWHLPVVLGELVAGVVLGRPVRASCTPATRPSPSSPTSASR